MNRGLRSHDLRQEAPSSRLRAWVPLREIFVFLCVLGEKNSLSLARSEYQVLHLPEHRAYQRYREHRAADRHH